MAGRIVEADFTLRQITFVEVALDLAALRLGTSGWEVIEQARMGEDNVFSIAETHLSRCLDEARRAVWVEAGEPERPEHPPQRFLVEKDGYSIEPLEYLRGGDKADREQQIAARKRQHRDDAAAQVEWESSQRRAYEERRASDASP